MNHPLTIHQPFHQPSLTFHLSALARGTWSPERLQLFFLRADKAVTAGPACLVLVMLMLCCLVMARCCLVVVKRIHRWLDIIDHHYVDSELMSNHYAS